MSTLLVSSSWQEKNEYINMNSNSFLTQTQRLYYILELKTTDQCPAAFDKVDNKTTPKMLRIFGSLKMIFYLNALCIEM